MTGLHYLIQQAMFRARIRDFMMCKLLSTLLQHILQVPLCMRLQCLLCLRKNFAGSDDDVLSLMVNNI